MNIRVAQTSNEMNMAIKRMSAIIIVTQPLTLVR
jgi:hypothetical protein